MLLRPTLPSQQHTASRPRAASSWLAAPNRARSWHNRSCPGHAGHHGDGGGHIGVGQDLFPARHILAGLTGGGEELLEHIAGQTGGGIHGGQAEGGHGQDQHGIHHVVAAGAEHLGEHGGKAGGEHHGGGHGGAVGVLRPDVTNGADGDQGQSALDQHTAVSDGLGVLFLIQLLGGGAGAHQGSGSRTRRRRRWSRTERGTCSPGRCRREPGVS